MCKSRNTIAILGVDGSGKSTAVENLSQKFGNRCSVTYMGYTRFEDKRIERLQELRFTSPIVLLLIYNCFWKRYLNAIHHGNFAIFDRYVHEIFLNANKNWWFSRVSIVLYKYLFPMPQKIVYLHCSVDKSLNRKNDIEKPEVFKAMKERFDNYFLNRDGVLCLDSGELSPEEITIKISEFINTSFGYDS